MTSYKEYLISLIEASSRKAERYRGEVAKTHKKFGLPQVSPGKHGTKSGETPITTAVERKRVMGRASKRRILGPKGKLPK